MGAEAASPPLLLRHDEGAVCRLTLNRPARRNPLSLAMISALREALGEIARERTAGVVVLAAAGPVFCAGHDLRELAASRDPLATREIFTACSELMLALQALPQPVIACVQGTATAAGCQLVASCDLAIAADSAAFATPGVRIGLFCSTPMVALTRAVPAKVAMEMLLTGDSVSAAEAERIGLINRAVPADRLEADVAALARKVASHSRLAVGIGKEGFRHQLELPVDRAYDYTSALMVRNMLAEDAAEGIDAFLARRPPEWRHR